MRLASYRWIKIYWKASIQISLVWKQFRFCSIFYYIMVLTPPPQFLFTTGSLSSLISLAKHVPNPGFLCPWNILILCIHTDCSILDLWQVFCFPYSNNGVGLEKKLKKSWFSSSQTWTMKAQPLRTWYRERQHTCTTLYRSNTFW